MAHLTEQGGIAQLVERCLCKAEVSGSSPLTSMSESKSRTQQQDLNKSSHAAGNLISSKNLENCIVNQVKVTKQKVSEC